ncbi:glycerate kinase [Corynebacterium uropygiale]|uniref:Glycerate kinase n=1 Tax=Corynebacterium uropygiale TaxID=1775911 RepID=A0A9X1QQG6_9CORY|nr:glycerate kinase [Corynebacterium uropygiale]MCF4006340.1 glycerate kinase [Corynebacterium uropygiale]
MSAPRILLCPDSFKGTASASEAARFLATGLREYLPQAEIIESPLADGGEGTAELLGGAPITLPTTTAAGRLTEATYYWDESSATAHIDLAAASGLPAVSEDPVPLRGDTYGTGVLIADAHSRGARRIVLCLGGSASTDGGTGILVALGAQLHDERGYPLPPGGGSLGRLGQITLDHLNVGAAALDWELLTDVTNPATGPRGAAHVFAPQKGASPEEVEVLDAGIARLCEFCEVDPQAPGLGAAGATPVGIVWVSRLLHGDDSHVSVRPGAATVIHAQGIAETMATSDLVVTGEGSLDEQSFGGKLIGQLAEMTKAEGRELLVVAGRVAPGLELPSHVHALELPSGEVQWQLEEAGRAIAERILAGGLGASSPHAQVED